MRKEITEYFKKNYGRSEFNPFTLLFKKEELDDVFRGIDWLLLDEEIKPTLLSEQFPTDKDYYVRLIKYVEKKMKETEEIYLELPGDRRGVVNYGSFIYHIVRERIRIILQGLYIEKPEILEWGIIELSRNKSRYPDILRKVEQRLRNKKKREPDFILPEEIETRYSGTYVTKEGRISGGTMYTPGEFLLGWYDEIKDEDLKESVKGELKVDRYEIEDIKRLYKNYLGKEINTVDELFLPENLEKLKDKLLRKNIKSTYWWHAKLLFTITHD